MVRPESSAQSTVGWGPHHVSKLLRGMSKAKVSLSVRSLNLQSDMRPDPVLSKIAKKPISKKELHELACIYFGTWGRALRAASLAHGAEAHNRFWNRDLIIECIKKLHLDGHPLTVTSIWRDRSRRTTRLIQELTGRRTSGTSLHEAGRRFFCSWDRALVAAGIDLLTVKERPLWTREKILIAILLLNESGVPLNPGFLQYDRSQKTAQVLASRFKKGTGSGLYGAGIRVFGSWRAAMEEAGLDPGKYQKFRYRWDKRSVRKIIKALHRSRVELNGGSISRNISENAHAVVLRASGRRIQARHIYNLGRKYLGSWDNSLRYSGLAPGSIRKVSSPCRLAKDDLVNIIQVLHKNEFPLNPTAMDRESKKVRVFLDSRFHQATGGRGVKKRSKELFGSWDQALWECGLDPNAIRLVSRPRTTNLPIVLYQIEEVKVGGERRRTRFLGAPPKSPDAELEERDAKAKLESAVRQLGSEDQELAEQIFSAVLQMHHYRDQKQLIQFVARWIGGAVTEGRVASIMASLARAMST